MLLGPQPQVLDARGFTVQAGQGAGGLQDGGGPDLLSVGQRLVIGLTVQGAERGHVDVHAQVGHGRGCPHLEGGVMHQVVGGCHVLAELLLQAEEAQGRGGVGVSLSQATAGGRRHGRTERGLCSRRQRGWGVIPTGWVQGLVHTPERFRQQQGLVPCTGGQMREGVTAHKS